jgi:cytochrome c biogenesis protein CcmG/thiol:disulfide interchange protein DsbE
VLLLGSAVACSDDEDSGLPAIDPDGAASVVAAPFTTFDGVETTLAKYAGTPVVVNFFQSYCAPCVVEMPDFEAVHQDIGDRVAFVGVAVQDTPEDARAIIERTGITYDVGQDPDGSMWVTTGGFGMPTTVLVRADGTVAEVHSLALNEDELRDLIRDELGVT